MLRLSIVEIGAFKEWGGREQHIVDLTKGLIEHGHEVAIVSRKQNYFPEDVPVITMPLKNAFDIKSIFGLLKFIHKKQVDILHVHNGREAWLAVLTALFAPRVKVVVTQHMVLPVKRRWANYFFYRQIAKVICVSHCTYNAFVKDNPYISPSKVSVVHNGINTDKFLQGARDDIRKRLGINSHEKILGLVGKLDLSKGHLNFLQTFKKVIDVYPDVKLVVVGKPQKGKEDHLEAVIKEAKRLGIEKQVIFFGFSSDIPSVMANIDILVFPSATQEAFGLVACEAMICGKPVVASDNGGQREIIDNKENGFLTPVGSSEDMAKVILELLHDANLRKRIGDAAKVKIMNQFTIKTMTKNTLSVFYKAQKSNRFIYEDESRI